MKREVIEKPFEKNLHRRIERTGAIYVEGAEYIRRLNEATKGQWSFTVIEYKINEREVIVLGQLVSYGITKHAFGSSVIKRSRKTNEPLNIGDDLKAASTDALKKASTLFGLGLEIHSKDFIPTPAEEQKAPAPKNDEGHPKGKGVTHGQLDALRALRETFEWDAETLIEAVGNPMELSKGDAQQAIEKLQKRALDLNGMAA